MQGFRVLAFKPGVIFGRWVLGFQGWGVGSLGLVGLLERRYTYAHLDMDK